MNKAFYPLHPTLKNSLRTLDAPLLGVRLIRRLAKTFKVSESAVEILLGLTPEVHKVPVSVKTIRTYVRHLSAKKVQTELAALIAAKLVMEHTVDVGSKKPEIHYSVTATVINAVASIDKDQLL